MAKGNDGNYLQHCVEVEAAALLAQTEPNRKLHIALTHGMEPFEEFEESKPNVQQKLLCNALDEAAGEPKCNEREIIKAYRSSRASRQHYPNTAELLRTVIGKERLSGGITEVCKAKCKKLSNTWNGSKIKVADLSWREELEDGILRCPGNLNAPWLFSMDPMNYKEEGKNDDEYLYRSDLDLLAPALQRYIGSGQPGIAALFVYSVGSQGENKQRQFWAFMDELAGRLRVPTHSYWVAHNGGNLNLAGLLFSDKELASGIVLPRIKSSRRKVRELHIGYKKHHTNS